VKNTTHEMKNVIGSFYIRLDQAEERIFKLKDRLFEIIQSEEERKITKTKKESLYYIIIHRL
jgi:hypothetical protein